MPVRSPGPDAATAEERVALTEVDGFIWHGYLHGVGPGQRYGYRVHGAVRPAGRAPLQSGQAAARPVRQGDRGLVRWGQPVFGYQFGQDDEPDRADSAPFVPRGVVANPYFDWGNDRPPRTPYHQSVIYEAHVRGLTMLHPAVPRRAARDVRGPRPPGGHRAPAGPRRHRDRADARAPVRQRRLPGRTRPVQLLGLQHHRLLRSRTTPTRRRASWASRCPSSSPWCGHCTRLASRSYSTSSTTTRPRATTSAPRCRSAASTTPPITG